MKSISRNLLLAAFGLLLAAEGMAQPWQLTGNNNTTSSSFLGTQSGGNHFKPLVIKTNGVDAIRVDGTNQNVGIGITVPTHRLDVRATTTANSAIVRFSDTQSRRIFFVPRLGAGGYSWVSNNNDAGIFWSNNANQNSTTTGAGFVIAPHMSSDWAGMRLGPDGKIEMPGYNTTVGRDMGKLGLGNASGQDLAWGTSYLGFNAARNKSGSNFTLDTDGVHNGGNVIWGDYEGKIRFACIANGQFNNGNGSIDQTPTAAQILSTTKMTIANDGKVVIGDATTLSTNSCSSNFRLFVKDGILTEHVMVTTYGGTGSCWPDYVFGKGYDLLPLEKVEAFVKENGHLPNIPSEKQIEENGGFELKEMAIKHMEKIEEVYLHLIDLNKEMKALKAENAELREQIQSLQK